MQSRERVLQALNFQQPDRVPVDLGGHRAGGIMGIAYVRLREYLGLPKTLPRIYDVPQQLAIVEEDVLQRFQVDVIELGRAFCQDDSCWQPWVLPNGVECLIPRWINPVRQNGDWVVYHRDGTPIAIQKQSMIYFDQACFPFRDKPEATLDRLEEMLEYEMWSALPSPPGPTIPYDAAGLRALAEGARRLRESTSRAIVGMFRCPLLEGGQHLFGMDGFYLLLAGEPDLAHGVLDGLLEIYLRRLELYLSAVGPYIDVMVCYDDYGMQTGPQISPTMYREFFKPRQRAIWQAAKKLSPAKVMLHSCGSIFDLLPDMLEAGLDVLTPVQITAKGMAPEHLKAAFGKRLVFWGGGCDTQHVLRAGTPAEIRAHVHHNLDIFAPGGGYVFQQVHNIEADVPPQNIVAMFDAVSEWNAARS
jgi:uroporphyrinogen decarboxylase